MSSLEMFRTVRAALQRQNDWHLARTDPVDMGGVPIIPAEAYVEGSMHDETVAALNILDREIAKFERIRSAARHATDG